MLLSCLLLSVVLIKLLLDMAMKSKFNSADGNLMLGQRHSEVPESQYKSCVLRYKGRLLCSVCKLPDCRALLKITHGQISTEPIFLDIPRIGRTVSKKASSPHQLPQKSTAEHPILKVCSKESGEMQRESRSLNMKENITSLEGNV